MHIYLYFLLYCLFVWPQVEVPPLPRDFTVLHNDPAAPQDYCGRCRIRTPDLCPRSLARGQWATTSPEMSIYYLKGNVYYHWTVTLWSLKVRDFMKMRAESVFFRKISFNPKKYDIVLFSATFIKKNVFLWGIFKY